MSKTLLHTCLYVLLPCISLFYSVLQTVLIFLGKLPSGSFGAWFYFSFVEIQYLIVTWKKYDRNRKEEETHEMTNERKKDSRDEGLNFNLSEHHFDSFPLPDHTFQSFMQSSALPEFCRSLQATFSNLWLESGLGWRSESTWSRICSVWELWTQKSNSVSVPWYKIDGTLKFFWMHFLLNFQYCRRTASNRGRFLLPIATLQSMPIIFYQIEHRISQILQQGTRQDIKQER